MKKKTPFYLGVFLILAVLMLGIGYAAISNNLRVHGDAKAAINNENLKVKFDSTVTPEVTKSDESFTVSATIAGDLEAKIDVLGLTTTNDQVTATYTIKNESPELGANLVVGSISNINSEYFDVNANLAKNSIGAGESTTIIVTVKLIKTPTEQQTTSINIPITATAVAS